MAKALQHHAPPLRARIPSASTRNYRTDGPKARHELTIKPDQSSGAGHVLKSGVHATLAGVIVALFIPIGSNNEEEAPLKRIEHGLAPWVAFGVMPIFAFANAGVALYGLSLEDLLSGIPLGIAAGLFLGKQLGIMAFVWTAVKVGIARLPDGVSWLQIYGVSALAGIGFTMSLFIGTLAFSGPEHAAAVRIGVLTGSVASAVLGYLVLRYSLNLSESRSATDRHAKSNDTVCNRSYS